MPNELIPYQQYVSPDLYLGDIKRSAGSFPTHDEVKAAVHAFCPFNPVTGDMLAKKSVSSLHVLTKITYLPFYPELLGLLTTPIFVAKCLMDIEEYLKRYKLFDKAYGLLLLKILSLGNMAGILEQMDQLDSFINSMLWLKLKSQKGTFDITTDLVHKTVSILRHKMNTWRGFVDLSFWNYGINITIDGQPKHERYFTAERSQLLLDHLWEQRDLMVTTFAKSPAPGFSAVLLVMSSNELRRDFANQEFVHLIPRSRDLFARYTLVATLEENAVIQDQSRTSSTHHLAPVNLEDHRAMARLLTQQLLSTNQPDSFSAGYAAFILFQFSHSLRIDMAYELGIPVMEAGFQFFWRVCLDPERREEMWHEGGPYALQPVMLFSEIFIATPASRNARSMLPVALSTLYSIEFFDWCGRLMLLPVLVWPNVIPRGVDADEEQFKKQKIALDVVALLSLLTDMFAKCPSLLQPIDKQSYNDWAKVYDFAYELLVSLEPSARMYSYVKEFSQVWVKLGDTFGYLAELQRRRGRTMCLYARCTGHSVRGVERLVCGECLSGVYCSIWCQTADWARHSLMHTKT